MAKIMLHTLLAIPIMQINTHLKSVMLSGKESALLSNTGPMTRLRGPKVPSHVGISCSTSWLHRASSEAVTGTALLTRYGTRVKEVFREYSEYEK